MKKVFRLLKVIITVMILLLSVCPAKAETLTYAETDFEYDLTIRSWDGNTYKPSDFTEDYVLLIFGRQACGNTQNMISNAQRLLKLDASLKPVVMLIDDNNAQATVEDFVQSVPSQQSERIRRRSMHARMVKLSMKYAEPGRGRTRNGIFSFLKKKL